MKFLFTSIIKIIVIIFLIFLIGTLGTYWFEKITFLPLVNKNLDNLANTVWQVQSSISTLSVALLALVIGFSRERKYGVNILEYSFTKQKLLLTPYEEVIILIILTSLNYYFVATNKIFGTFFILIICTILILSILISTIMMLGFRKKIYDSIREELISECKETIIEENKVMEETK